MNELERLHRREPQRTGPVRDFSQLYRSPNGAAGVNFPAPEPPASAGRADDGSASPESQSVEDAYRIIQKHVDEGRQAAAQFSQSSSSRRPVGDPFQQLLERVIALQGDLLPLMLDLIRDSVRPPSQESSGDPRSHAPADTDDRQRVHWTAEVVSRRPVEITLDLREQSIGLPLATPGLHSLDGKPALREVSISPCVNDGPLRLRVVIPDNQIPGHYSGVVMNQHSGEVRGTISITIKD
jgi:hypothetical protein